MLLRRFGRCCAALALLAGLLLPLAAALAAPVLPELHGSLAATHWQGIETPEAYIFYTEDSLAEADLGKIKEQLAKDVEKVRGALKAALPRKFNLLLYPNSLKAPRYRDGVNVWPEDQATVHVVYDDEQRRNMTYHNGTSAPFLLGAAYVYSLALNPRPAYALAEGLALYVADYTPPQAPIEAYARIVLDDGKVMPLEQMDKVSEADYPQKARYMEPIAAAFARYVIRTYGFEKLLQAFKASGPGRLEAAIQAAYGKPLAMLEGEFQAFLKSYTPPSNINWEWAIE